MECNRAAPRTIDIFSLRDEESYSSDRRKWRFQGLIPRRKPRVNRYLFDTIPSRMGQYDLTHLLLIVSALVLSRAQRLSTSSELVSMSDSELVDSAVLC